MKDNITINAFGQAVSLFTNKNKNLIEDSLWRLNNVYIPYISSRVILDNGLALDIGAGFGVFAIPFAKAYQNIELLCFEPDVKCYELLCKNIVKNNINNIKAFNCAVSDSLPVKNEFDLLRKGKVQNKIKLKTTNGWYRDYDPESGVEYDAISIDSLLNEKPAFIKAIVPNLENKILPKIAQSDCTHLVSETWNPLTISDLYAGEYKNNQFYIRYAGKSCFLRKDFNFEPLKREGLDVIVAMYNTKDYIIECVDSIIKGASEDVHVIVIDDGSTDGSAKVVRNNYKNTDRVKIVTKANGGCASARNYGLRVSDASHIAFVDADDLVDPGFFSELLSLARLTNSEMVQAGFDFYEVENNKGVRKPSYENDAFKTFERESINDLNYINIPSTTVMVGQPAIWRRVYRRDFLDNKKLFFPEHIRAFDDQFFQMCSLQYVYNIPMLEDKKYLYRQHPDQDIKQGDERHFYELEMFMMLLKRGMNEGWGNFRPILESFVNTINWSLANLKNELKPMFMEGAAEVWVISKKSMGSKAHEGLLERFSNSDLKFKISLLDEKLNQNKVNSYFVKYNNLNCQPNFVKV